MAAGACAKLLSSSYHSLPREASDAVFVPLYLDPDAKRWSANSTPSSFWSPWRRSVSGSERAIDLPPNATEDPPRPRHLLSTTSVVRRFSADGFCSIAALRCACCTLLTTTALEGPAPRSSATAPMPPGHDLFWPARTSSLPRAKRSILTTSSPIAPYGDPPEMVARMPNLYGAARRRYRLTDSAVEITQGRQGSRASACTSTNNISILVLDLRSPGFLPDPRRNHETSLCPSPRPGYRVFVWPPRPNGPTAASRSSSRPSASPVDDAKKSKLLEGDKPSPPKGTPLIQSDNGGGQYRGPVTAFSAAHRLGGGRTARFRL